MKKTLFTLFVTIAYFSSMTYVFAMAPSFGTLTYDAPTNTITAYIADLGGADKAIVGFEYGLDNSYGFAGGVTVLTAPGYVTLHPDLACGQNFHYRVFATNSGGGTIGTILSNDTVAECSDTATPPPAPTPAATEPEPSSTPTDTVQTPVADNPVVAPQEPQTETPEVTPPTEESPEKISAPETPVPAEDIPTLGAAAELSGFITQPLFWVILGAIVLFGLRRFMKKPESKQQ